MKRHLLLCLALCGVFGAAKAYHIVPAPVEQSTSRGSFTLSNKHTIDAPAASAGEATYLSELIREVSGLEILPGEGLGIKMVLRSDQRLGSEGYTLTVASDGITIGAQTDAGLFYGAQTLAQMIVQSKPGTRSVRLGNVEIVDYPRFSWRGSMLDCCRHFFGVEFIKTLLDNLALHKINKFHWHLTDDQGWRAQIDAYPRLTEVGAYRSGTLIGRFVHGAQEQYDSVRYGGFYTKQQMREVVEYASKLHITVIPEIEMPGHAQAAIAAYPWLGCVDYPVEVCKTWGVIPYIFNPYEPTFTFLETVLSEIMDIFPSEYIHIGGDEAIKPQWENNKIIQKQIAELGLHNEAQLQSWFVKRINDFVTAKGRKIIGWDEITEGGAPKGACIMFWRSWHPESLEEAVKGNHPIICTPTAHNYLDYRQMEDEASEPMAMSKNVVTLATTYSLEPIPSYATPEQARNVIGTQGNLWTEYIETPEHVEYMLFPRIAAIAECAWSPREHKNYDQFVVRLRELAKIYRKRGINYCDK